MGKGSIIKRMPALILCATLMGTACSTAWIGEAEKIVTVMVPATANVVTLVAKLRGNVSSADMQMVQSAGAQAGADLQLMQSLIAQYQKADAGEQPGLLGQIQAAISGVQATLKGLLPALHIKDAATQSKISAVVGIVLSEAESVAAIVPMVNAGASTGMMTMAAKQVRKQPPLTAGEFVTSYNATMTAKTGNTKLDRAAAGLRIHLHGKVTRWASAGWLK